MSAMGELLRRASEQVERPDGGWVPGEPDPSKGEVCAVTAVIKVSSDSGYWSALDALEAVVEPAAIPDEWGRIATWNLEQRSRAVVAAEMRSAADLADLIYPNGGTH